MSARRLDGGGRSGSGTTLGVLFPPGGAVLHRCHFCSVDLSVPVKMGTLSAEFRGCWEEQMNPQQSLTCSEHNTYDLVTVVSTAAPLQPKSSGPLSQLTEPVSCHPRCLLGPGWAGECLPSWSFLGLLLTRDAEVVGVGELSSSPSPHPQLQPASVSINPSSALPISWTTAPRHTPTARAGPLLMQNP